MNITPEQFLAKLAASPADARDFDQCAPRGMNRRAHVEFTLARVKNSCANVNESKRLADARAANSSLKSDLEKAMARIKFMTPEAIVRHNLHAAFGKKLPVGPAKPTKAVAPVAKAIAAASAKPQRELTGHARAAAAFAGTANRSAIISTPNLTGHARVSAFFARQAK
jgi:hypothetical protein